jgi:hypothetical protein
MQTWVRVSRVLASPETIIDQALAAHAAVVARLEWLIERNARNRPRFGAEDGLPNSSIGRSMIRAVGVTRALGGAGHAG